MSAPLYCGPEEIRRALGYPACIAAMREAMVALSKGETRQLLRSIIPLAAGRAFGIMPGALSAGGVFGAKLLSVDPGAPARGGRSHQGVVVLFKASGEGVSAILDAGEITAIRTGAASAAATDALARPEATRLAILGAGEQAASHARAIACVRDLSEIIVWGRSPNKARALAERLSRELSREVRFHPDARQAVQEADIICTASGARDPILFSDWVKDGCHINAVGSSVAGPAEIEPALVARARFIADHRAGILAQGGEFLRAKEAGLIDDAHVAAEIGEVFSGAAPGRRSPFEVTIYKSLGHIVQDLAAANLVVGDLR
ncbi:MAG: ornithine cyclodeaminase family protein [Caulobacteraceae bacterium]